MASKTYADIVYYYIDIYKIFSPWLNGCALRDPLAVAAAVNPSLIQTIYLKMKVDHKEPYTGRTIGDKKGINKHATKTQVALNVNSYRFLKEFMDKLSTLFQK